MTTNESYRLIITMRIIVVFEFAVINEWLKENDQRHYKQCNYRQCIIRQEEIFFLIIQIFLSLYERLSVLSIDGR